MTARTAEDEAEDARFFRWYGPWAPFDPPRLATFMAGFPRPWWIVGGWSIEAFTGVPREHEDVDLSILARDIPALRAHVGDDWCLWSNHGGTLRPLDERHPEVLDVQSQIWVRRSAAEPWVIDLPITPDADGLWTNKRMPDHVLPVEEATWVADDGLRYLRPEITLLYKAALDRPKDDRDLAVTWPLLAPEQQAWLRDAVRRLYPDHAWLERLGTVDPSGPSDPT
ncbi:MAG: nucleotidyltransferase domain-containing protein [Nocardioidaceae bacterium]